jgi:hypothetical protein
MKYFKKNIKSNKIMINEIIKYAYIIYIYIYIL